MTTVIGALRVTLGLDSTQFRRGAAAVGSMAGNLRDTLMGISAGVAAVGGAALLLVQQTAQAAGEVERQARLANTSAEEFQRMAAAAASVGIQQDKLSDILKDVNDRVGDFLSTGGGEMADFFENVAPKVGVTADMFRDLSGADALQLYVDTLQRAGLSQAEMTFYMEAMANDATALIPLLANGGAELDRLGDAAAGTGAIMSDDLIGSSAAFREQMRLLGQNITGTKNEIAEALMPVMTSLVEAINTSVIPVVRDVIGVVGEWIVAFQGLPAPVQEAVGAVVAVIGVGGPLLVALGAVKMAFTALVAATGPIGLFILAATTVVTAWTMFGDEIKAAIGSALDWVGEKFQWVSDKVQALIDLAGRAKDALAEVFSTAESAPLPSVAGGNYTETFGAGAGIGTALGEGMATGVVDSDAEQRLRDWVGGVVSGVEDELEIRSPSRVFQRIGQFIAAGLGLGVRDGAEGVEAAVGDTVGGAVDTATSAFAGLREAAKSAFVGVVTDARSATDAVGQLLSSLAQMLASSAFDALFGGGPGSGGGLIGSLFGGMRAEGGPVSAGMAYMVGERGRELFVPEVDGSIISHRDLLRMESGGSGSDPVQIVVRHEPGMLIETMQGQIAQAAPVIVRQSVAATGDMMRATKTFGNRR